MQRTPTVQDSLLKIKGIRIGSQLFSKLKKTLCSPVIVTLLGQQFTRLVSGYHVYINELLIHNTDLLFSNLPVLILH